MKWPKSEEKLTFGGRWAWVPMNPPPKQNFVATPLLLTAYHRTSIGNAHYTQ